MSRKGNVQVLCNEKMYVGPNWAFSLLFPVLVGIGTATFMWYTCSIVAARWLAGILYCCTFVCFIGAAFRDPGIIERGPPLLSGTPRPPSRWIKVPNYNNTSGNPSQDFFLVEQRWCFSCHIYRPLRSVHCRYCDVCVHRRDHHCPWIGTCVAARNYLFFYVMLWCFEVLLVTVAIGSTHSIIIRNIHIHYECSHTTVDGASRNCEAPSFFQAVAETYGCELILIFLSYLISVFVAALLIDQTRMAIHNEVFADRLHFNDKCVYDRGSLWANIKASFTFSPAEVALYEVADAPNQEVVEESKSFNGAEV